MRFTELFCAECYLSLRNKNIMQMSNSFGVSKKYRSKKIILKIEVFFFFKYGYGLLSKKYAISEFKLNHNMKKKLLIYEPHSFQF